jgi:hypothetical protein
MKLLAAIVALLVVVLASSDAHAHKPSDSYLQLDVAGGKVTGRWDIALRDLDHALDLDANGDAKITWGELDARAADVRSYASSRLSLHADGSACPASFEDKPAGIVEHSDGTYAVLRFDAACPAETTSFVVDYRLFFDVDPQHRGLLRVEGEGTTRTATVSASRRTAEISLEGASRLASFRKIVAEGTLHIWQGYDHILFLFALLLPSVLRRKEGGGWTAVEDLRPALGDVLRIVTAFTVSHSITLTLAALGAVTLPSRLVESAIAASVVLAAVNNLHPVLRQDRWAAAFLLGLMHGFGFSATLQDLDLPRAHLVSTLFGFNLGVEIGQVAIVLAFVPLAYAARRTSAYRRVALVGGSAAILALAMVWLVERAFEVRIVS